MKTQREYLWRMIETDLLPLLPAAHRFPVELAFLAGHASGVTDTFALAISGANPGLLLETVEEISRNFGAFVRAAGEEIRSNGQE